MPPAGPSSHKHVAASPQDGSPSPEDRPHEAPRHKAVRRTRLARLAGPAVFALSVTGTLVAVEVGDSEAGLDPTPAAVAPVDLSQRTAQVSRSISRAVSRTGIRPLATAKGVVLQPTAVDHEFATVTLNLRTAPSAEAPRVRTVSRGTRLAVTGQTSRGWSEVLVEREVPVEGRKAEGGATRTVARWVNGEYLAERKPAPPEPEPEPTSESSASSSASSSESSSASESSEPTTATSGLAGAPCPDGSTIESGITSGAVRLYRAVCAAFPALTTYGGYDAHGEHIDGRAIDFMITDSSLGQAVADYVLANAGALGVRDIIWSQRIWTPEQAASGWRYMEDRGSPTANHYDHVHVAVF
jgi:hypothetical protein